MKKYKKWLIAGAVLVPVIIVIILLSSKPETVIEAKTARVRVLKVESAINEEYAKYIGIIQPLELHQATFDTIGTIDTVYVKEGQAVKKGDLLATLDTESAQISLKNAKESLEAAKHQRDEAAALMRAEESGYQELKAESEQLILDAEAEMLVKESEMEAAEAEYQRLAEEHGPESEEAIAAYSEFLARQVEYELARAAYEGAVRTGEPVEVQIAYARYQAAKSAHSAADIQYNIAANNLELAQNNLNQSRLLATMEGRVVKVVSGAGDLATPLAPVVVIASHTVAAEIGLSQRDVGVIEVGMGATVTVNGKEIRGNVTDISLLPDVSSCTYQAKVALEDGGGLNLGETAAVQILTGPKEGIWLSLPTIMNDGEDFVFVVVEGRISRRTVTLSSVANELVLVQGLEPGDYVVVEGGRLLRPGIQVEITEVVNGNE